MRDYEALVVEPGDGSCSLELLPAHGGAANFLYHHGADGTSFSLLAGNLTQDEIQADPFYRGAVLYPWVNRLDGGRYRWRGGEYCFPVNEVPTNTTLHGFLWRLRPLVEDLRQERHEASVSFRYRYEGEFPGYPFPAEIRLRYRLHAEEGLRIDFQVRNLHSAAVPLGIGWHPYLGFEESIDSVLLQLPPSRRMLLDARMLPTGVAEDFAGFSEPRPIGPLHLDDCFELLSSAGGIARSRLWSESRGVGVELWQQTPCFPYVQVFTPPDRRSIAIEPVSCGINAFNTGEHLVQLAPGEAFSAACGVRVTKAAVPAPGQGL